MCVSAIKYMHNRMKIFCNLLALRLFFLLRWRWCMAESWRRERIMHNSGHINRSISKDSMDGISLHCTPLLRKTAPLKSLSICSICSRLCKTCQFLAWIILKRKWKSWRNRIFLLYIFACAYAPSVCDSQPFGPCCVVYFVFSSMHSHNTMRS